MQNYEYGRSSEKSLALTLEDELYVNAVAIPHLRFEKGSSHE
jgi:hypothetical protein